MEGVIHLLKTSSPNTASSDRDIGLDSGLLRSRYATQKLCGRSAHLVIPAIVPGHGGYGGSYSLGLKGFFGTPGGARWYLSVSCSGKGVGLTNSRGNDARQRRLNFPPNRRASSGLVQNRLALGDLKYMCSTSHQWLLV
jgi:hypothetical protein